MPRVRTKKRPDGYYRVYYKSKQFYGKTQSEALTKRDLYIQKEMAGLDTLNHEKSVFINYANHWIEIYRDSCNVMQKRQYLTIIAYCAERLPRMMKDINVQDLQRLCNTMNHYSASYVSKFLSTLRGIFDTAQAEGVILRNPLNAVRKPKCKATEGHRALEEWERQLIRSTFKEHEFGPAAMVMMYAGLRRGEMLAIDIDRDVDFKRKTITVNQAVAFVNGQQAVITSGKTKAAHRTIPLAKPLEMALRGKHGLLLSKKDGEVMTLSAFERKYDSYINFLEIKLNGCAKRWYGRTKEHKEMLARGEKLPPWRSVKIRCHDFRVDFCTRNYEAGIPIKTLQTWMGHTDAQMIMNVYAKLTKEQEELDALKLIAFMDHDIPDELEELEEKPEIPCE